MKVSSNKIALAIVFALFICVNKVSSQQKKCNIPFDKNVATGTLQNGLTYYIKETANPSDNIEMRLIVKAGYAQEEQSQLHYAHVLEHMAARSTQSFPDVWDFVKAQGLRLGADFQAVTGYYCTTYGLKTANYKADLVSGSLLWFSEILSKVTLDFNAIENGKNTVLAEIATNRGIDINDSFPQTLSKHDRAQILSVHNLDHKEIIRYYNDWYRPDLAAVIVVGKVRKDSIEALIRKTFATLKPRSNRPYFISKPENTWSPDNWNYQLRTVGVTSLSMSKYHSTFNICSYDDYKRLYTILLFNKMSKNRFSQLKKFPGIEAMSLQYIRKAPDKMGLLDALSGSLAFKKGINKKEAETAIKTWLELMEQVNQYGFTADELVKAKGEFLHSANVFTLRTPAEISDALEQHFLGNRCFGDPAFMQRLLKDLSFKISLADIRKEQQLWKKWTMQDFLFVGSSLEASVLPSKVDFHKLLKESQLKRPARFSEKAEGNVKTILSIKQVAALREQKVQFEKRTIPDLDATILQLENGITIVLKPTRESSKKILMQAFNNGGTGLFQANKTYLAPVVNRLIQESGAGIYDKAQIKSILSDSHVELTPYVSGKEVGFTAETNGEGMDVMLQAVREYILHPRIDTLIDKSILQSELVQLSAVDSINNIYSTDHSSGPTGSTGDFTFHMKEVADISRKAFSNPYGFNFVIAGNFNRDTIEQLVLRYLGTIPYYQSKYSTNAGKESSSAGGNAYVIKNSIGGTVNVNMFIYNKIDTGLQSFMKRELLRAVLEGAILNRLRDTMGVCYSSAVVTKQRDEEWQQWGISANLNNQDLDTAIKAVWEEIEKIKHAVLSKEKLEIGKAYLLSFYRNQQSTFFWNEHLATSLRYGRSIIGLSEMENILSVMTIADIAATARRCLMVNSIEYVIQ